MSFTSERLISEKRRGNESKKEAMVNNGRDEVDKRAEHAVQWHGRRNTHHDGFAQSEHLPHSSLCLWRSWFPRIIFIGMCTRFWISRLSTIWCASATRWPVGPPLIQLCSGTAATGDVF
jgi:hypothetical protein